MADVRKILPEPEEPIVVSPEDMADAVLAALEAGATEVVIRILPTDQENIDG